MIVVFRLDLKGGENMAKIRKDLLWKALAELGLSRGEIQQIIAESSAPSGRKPEEDTQRRGHGAPLDPASDTPPRRSHAIVALRRGGHPLLII